MGHAFLRFVWVAESLFSLLREVDCADASRRSNAIIDARLPVQFFVAWPRVSPSRCSPRRPRRPTLRPPRRPSPCASRQSHRRAARRAQTAHLCSRPLKLARRSDVGERNRAGGRRGRHAAGVDARPAHPQPGPDLWPDHRPSLLLTNNRRKCYARHRARTQPAFTCSALSVRARPSCRLNAADDRAARRPPFQHRIPCSRVPRAFTSPAVVSSTSMASSTIGRGPALHGVWILVSVTSTYNAPSTGWPAWRL